MKKYTLSNILINSLVCSISLLSTNSYSDSASITVNGNQRCIQSNGLPDHATGNFPNSGNPHQIKSQNIRYCFPLSPQAVYPQRKASPRRQGGSIGVALNGITIRPGTADYYDSSSQRGHSRDRSSGWNLEGLGSRDLLGMDQNNAHVDKQGMYHYHGVADALVQSTKHHGTLLGYAADGFEIHYVPTQVSSYQLKQGTRPSAPYGRYDGSYNQDWEYIAGSGSLDTCNGGVLNGQFVYFATETYPFFPRCLWGTASADFGRDNASASKPSSTNKQKQPRKQKKRSSRGLPPAEALAACQNSSPQTSCAFTHHSRNIKGQCRHVPSGELACVPTR
jgi:hypothetical protein